MSTKITIPSEHYVGMRSQYRESLPLAFITPNGSDKAALKRIQTVDRQSNPLYYKLIMAFKELSGLGMLLNTSLNIRGEPMVNDRNDEDRFEKLYNVKVIS